MLMTYLCDLCSEKMFEWMLPITDACTVNMKILISCATPLNATLIARL